jgi:glutamine synthetase
MTAPLLKCERLVNRLDALGELCEQFPNSADAHAERCHTVTMDRQREYVLRTVEERGVRFVRLWFTDVLGTLKSVAITPADLEAAFDEGVTFDGSAIDGYSRVQEADMLAVPDPSTFEILPWRGDAAPVGRMFCDIQLHNGEPFPGDPRQVLRRNLQKAREAGFTLFAGPEMEFFYFKDLDTSSLLDRGGYFDHTASTKTSDLRRDTILALEAMSIPVEYSHHEVSYSQQEIDLRYDDALSMADAIMTFRHVVRVVAQHHDVHATFMPKPRTDLAGSGMHTHFSLFEGDRNAFADADSPDGLSVVAHQFIAGLLHHAREITAVTNQWINSYKRLTVGLEAPVFIGWARNNRSALVRVPLVKKGKASSTRVEFRAPDPACNPYLAYSVILAAGLKGITEGYELPPAATNNIFEMSQVERVASGINALPETLNEALDEMENSELVADALGEHVFSFFIRNKRADWDEYRRYVSPFEVDRYLGSL